MDKPQVPSIEEVLYEPSVHTIVKDHILAYLEKDPVDAMFDARLVADLMEQRCNNILGIIPTQ